MQLFWMEKKRKLILRPINEFYHGGLEIIQYPEVSFYFVEVSKHYNSKVSLEHQLPTATQKLKTTDECVVSSLISLVTCTGKVSDGFIR